MTRRVISSHENELEPAEEAFQLTARLTKASETDEKEFEQCVEVLLASPDKFDRVLDELAFDQELILAQAIYAKCPVLAVREWIEEFR